jgi:hypothetical protein
MFPECSLQGWEENIPQNYEFLGDEKVAEPKRLRPPKGGGVGPVDGEVGASSLTSGAPYLVPCRWNTPPVVLEHEVPKKPADGGRSQV